MARVPIGFSGPGGTTSGSSGSSARIRSVGRQIGSFVLRATVVVPSGVVRPSRPMPIGYERGRAPGCVEVIKAHVREVDHHPLGLGVGERWIVGSTTLVPSPGSQGSVPGLAATIST